MRVRVGTIPSIGLIIPAVGAVLAAVAVSLYKLDDKFMKQIEAELEARRREAGQQPAEA